MYKFIVFIIIILKFIMLRIEICYTILDLVMKIKNTNTNTTTRPTRRKKELHTQLFLNNAIKPLISLKSSISLSQYSYRFLSIT